MGSLGVGGGGLILKFKKENTFEIDAESDFVWGSASDLAPNNSTRQFLPLQMHEVEGQSTETAQVTIHPPVDVKITKMKFKVVANTLDGTAELHIRVNGVDVAKVFDFDNTQAVDFVGDGINLPITILAGDRVTMHYVRGTTTIDGMKLTISGHLVWQ